MLAVWRLAFRNPIPAVATHPGLLTERVEVELYVHTPPTYTLRALPKVSPSAVLFPGPLVLPQNDLLLYHGTLLLPIIIITMT